MFKICLADLNIEISNRYRYVKRYFRKYRIKAPKTDFSVLPDFEEIEKEYSDINTSLPFCENLYIYKNISETLPLFNAFLIHAAAVVKDNKAYLFLAKSEGGKTTHAMLWKKEFGSCAKILNGDKPILKKTESGWKVYGSPWQGKENKGFNGSFPLKSACFIIKGTENKIKQISLQEAKEKILNQIFIPRKEENLKALLDLVSDLLCSVPFYSMTCKKEKDAVVLAYNTMK